MSQFTCSVRFYAYSALLIIYSSFPSGHSGRFFSRGAAAIPSTSASLGDYADLPSQLFWFWRYIFRQVKFRAYCGVAFFIPHFVLSSWTRRCKGNFFFRKLPWLQVFMVVSLHIASSFWNVVGRQRVEKSCLTGKVGCSKLAFKAHPIKRTLAVKTAYYIPEITIIAQWRFY